MLNLFSFHLISSHRSFSWKLLTASHCHRSLYHPISSQLISCLLSFFHRISPYPISCLLSHSQLFSADHDCSLLFSCHVSFSHLFSSQLLSAFLRFSQLFSALLSALSNHPCSPLAENLLRKRISAPKQTTPGLSTEKI